MSLQNTPSSERVHIGFFGCRNAGNQPRRGLGRACRRLMSPGTTTDPVQKRWNSFRLALSSSSTHQVLMTWVCSREKRVQKTRQTLAKTDIAVLVADGVRGLSAATWSLSLFFRKKAVAADLEQSRPDRCSRTGFFATPASI